MKLAVQKRVKGTKGDVNKLRREGNIPGILYGSNEPGIPVHVKADEVHAILRNLKQGLLSTTVFELSEGSTKHKAVIKDIQYHVATYDVVHIDFALLKDNEPVTLNVPIQMIGVGDCAGVKLGGFIRQVIRSLKVSCLPKHIPSQFTLNVRDLDVGQAKRLSDIEMPAHVRPIGKLDQVAVLVAKKAGT
jgi:large subunit ribosomal protein L25